MFEYVLNTPNKFSSKNDVSPHQESLIDAMTKLEKNIKNDTWSHASYSKTDLKMMPAMVDLANKKNPNLNLKFVNNPNDLAAFIKASLLEGQSVLFVVNMLKDGLHFTIVDSKRTNGKISAIMVEPINVHGSSHEELANAMISALDQEHINDCHFSVVLADIQRNNSECGFFSLALANKLYSDPAGLADLHQQNIILEITNADFFIPTENGAGESVIEDNLTLEEQFDKFMKADEQEFAKFQAFRNSTRPQGEFVFTATPKYSWLEPAIHLTNSMMPGMLSPQQQTLTDTTMANTQVSSHNSTSPQFPEATSASAAKDPLLPLTIPLTAAALATTSASRGGYYVGATLGTAAVGLLTWLGVKHFTGSSSASTTPSPQVENTSPTETTDVFYEYDMNSARWKEELQIIDNLDVPNLDFLFDDVLTDVNNDAPQSKTITTSSQDISSSNPKADIERRGVRSADESQLTSTPDRPSIRTEIEERQTFILNVMSPGCRHKANELLARVQSSPDVVRSASLSPYKQDVIYLLKTAQYFHEYIRTVEQNEGSDYTNMLREFRGEMYRIITAQTNPWARAEINRFLQTRSALSKTDSTSVTEKISFVPEVTEVPTTISPEETLEEYIISNGESVLRKNAALLHPIMNPVGFIDSHIKRIVADVNNTKGSQFPLDPNHKIKIDVTRQIYQGGNPKYADKVYATREFTLRDIATGQYRVVLNSILPSNRTRKEVYNSASEKYLADALWGVNLEQSMLAAVKEFRGTGNDVQKREIREQYKKIATQRCLDYLSIPNPKYKDAVERFLEGSSQASEVFFNNIVVQGVFMIHDGDYNGVLLNINEPGFVDVGVSENPNTPKLREWVLNGIPAVEAKQYEDTSFAGFLNEGSQPGYTGPIIFWQSSDRDTWSARVFHRFVETLEQEIDRMVHTVDEANDALWLERAKTTIAIAAAAASFAIPGVGSTAGRLALFLTSLGLDASYVAVAVQQGKNTDDPDTAAAYYKEAIIAGVLAGVINFIPGYQLTRQGITKAVKTYRGLKTATDQAVPKLLSNMQWTKLNDQGKIKAIVDSIKNSDDAAELIRLSGSNKAVAQSVDLGRPRGPTGQLKGWEAPADALRRARDNLKHHAKAFKMQTRPHITDLPPSALPEEMRSYLSELRNKPNISNWLRSPEGKCEAMAQPVSDFMKTKGMTDIKFRGIQIWKTPEGLDTANHFVVLGSKNGQEYVFDLTAGQFAPKGMSPLDGPKILPEREWVKLYQDAAGQRRLMVYQDFNDMHEATRVFSGSGTTLFDFLEQGELTGTILKKPSWFETYLGKKFSRGTR